MPVVPCLASSESRPAITAGDHHGEVTKKSIRPKLESRPLAPCLRPILTDHKWNLKIRFLMISGRLRVRLARSMRPAPSRPRNDRCGLLQAPIGTFCWSRFWSGLRRSSMGWSRRSRTRTSAVKFETLRHVHDIFDKCDWLWLADLKAAYHSILVQERLARQLGFKWNNIYYKWLSLPFGFSLSPYCFQRLMRQVVKHCRYLRMKILQFLDDGMGGHASFVEAVRQRNDMYILLCKLGFRLSTKSSPLPEQTKIFLGMVVHMAGMVPTFHVPQDKIDKLQNLLHESVNELDTWSMRKLAKITGKCLSMSLAIPMTRLMSRSMYECMHSFTSLHILHFVDNCGKLRRSGGNLPEWKMENCGKLMCRRADSNTHFPGGV